MAGQFGCRHVNLALEVRDLDYADVGDLDWSGSGLHVAAVARELEAAYADQCALLVVTLPNGHLVALGGVDFRREAGVGVLWMLSVHETMQSMGIGTLLIGALEERARRHGCGRAQIAVEHDNPRAAALYRRLGYVECGTGLDSWPVAGGETYVTVCTVLERQL
jgi:ribosomal protein S18 acetylase RimI-like enzyme